MDLISIIIPVYKVETYLDHCVESIVNQTYTNLEIILIDDGSPDNSPAICDEWAKKDSRIRVIHQKNTGGGPARNTGLEVASGELVAFVDSDDYIAPNMYEYLHGLLKPEIDIAECDYLETYDNSAVFPSNPSDITIYTAEQAMSAHIQDTAFKQLIWNKLYRRHTLENVRFPAGTKIDDEFFTYKVLGNAKKLVHSDLPLYAYRQQDDSLMHSMDTRRRAEAIEAKVQRNAYLQEHFPSLVGESLKNLWFTALFQGQLALREIPSDSAQDSINYIISRLTTCPLSREYFAKYSLKERLWLHMAQRAFISSCRLRNWLKIGL